MVNWGGTKLATQNVWTREKAILARQGSSGTGLALDSQWRLVCVMARGGGDRTVWCVM